MRNLFDHRLPSMAYVQGDGVGLAEAMDGQSGRVIYAGFDYGF